MTDLIIVSAAPEQLARATTLGDGIEAKLDWEHHETLSGDFTLSEACVDQSVDPESITSVHLPPGIDRPRGLSVAPGNVGDILDFVHGAFGDRVDPEWLTVHTTRSCDYRDHVDRLATITERGGYALAVENTPDASCFYTAEDIAAMAYLTSEVPRLNDVSVLIDTAHVPTERRELAVDDGAVASVLDRFDEHLRAVSRNPSESSLRPT